MLIEFLTVWAKPMKHSRDRKTLYSVGERILLQGVLLLMLGGLSIFWESARTFINIFAVLLGCGILFHLYGLRKEFQLRKKYRAGRLALPPILADGIRAAECGNAEKTAHARRAVRTTSLVRWYQPWNLWIRKE